MRVADMVISIIVIVCVAFAADYDNFLGAVASTAPTGLPLVGSSGSLASSLTMIAWHRVYISCGQNRQGTKRSVQSILVDLLVECVAT